MKKEVTPCVVRLRGLEPPSGNRYISVNSGASCAPTTGWVSQQLEYAADRSRERSSGFTWTKNGALLLLLCATIFIHGNISAILTGTTALGAQTIALSQGAGAATATMTLG